MGRVVPVERPVMSNLRANAVAVEIFTDGACIRNPGGDGGWGFVAVRDGKKIAEFCGADPKTTSNRAELKAIIRALLWSPPGASATIVSDSEYAVKVLSGEYRAKANLDLIEEARALMQERQIKFRWVRGHAGDRWNERADALAAQGMGWKRNFPLSSRIFPLRKVKKRKKHKRLAKRRGTGRSHADLRRRAEQDGLCFEDSLPAHLIP